MGLGGTTYPVLCEHIAESHRIQPHRKPTHIKSLTYHLSILQSFCTASGIQRKHDAMLGMTVMQFFGNTS